MNTETLARTREEAVRDIHYLSRLCRVHARLYGRLNRHCKLATALACGAALGVLLGGGQFAMAWAASAIAISAYITLAINPAEREQQFVFSEHLIDALLTHSDEMSMKELDVRRMMTPMPPVIEALRTPCYNSAMTSLGHEELVRPLNFFERLMDSVA